MMTLEDLRAQAMDDLTPGQLREASAAPLLLCGWEKIVHTEYVGPPDWRAPDGRMAGNEPPNPAASRDDAAALMPEGQAVQVNVFDDTAIVTSWHCDDPTDQNEEEARTEPYARMLAAVAANSLARLHDQRDCGGSGICDICSAEAAAHMEGKT